MALNIKNAETDRLVRELAAETGESITTAVGTAVRERLDRVQSMRQVGEFVRQIGDIAARCAALPQRPSLGRRDARR